MVQKEIKMKLGEIVDLYYDDKIDLSFECYQGYEVERKDIWTFHNKSLYLNSLLNGYIVMPICLIKEEDTYINYSVLDGKQRILAIVRYINNEYPLHEYTPSVNGEEVHGLCFWQLSKGLQEKLLNYEITIIEQIGDSVENVNMYVRYNSGTPIKPIELFRAKLGGHATLLREITGHKLFRLTSLNNIKRFQDYELALYILMLESNPSTGLSKKEKELFVDRLSKTSSLNRRIKSKIKYKLDYLYNTFNNNIYLNLMGERYLKKSHLIMLYSLMDMVIDIGLSEEDFFSWCHNFFYLQKDISNTYWIEASRGSTTSRNSMDIKLKELKKDFAGNFIKEAQ